MKKILLLSIISASLNAGGIWDMVKNGASDGTIKTKQYTISTSGVDNRAYVFTVPEMKSVCVLTYSDKGVPSMVCKTFKEIEGK